MRIEARRGSLGEPDHAVLALASAALLAALVVGASTLSGADGTRVALPAASLLVEAPSGSAIVVVAGDATRAVYRFSDGRRPCREVDGPRGIFLEARRVLASSPGKAFVVRADARILYGAVDEALEALRRAGARRIVLAARPVPAPGRSS